MLRVIAYILNNFCMEYAVHMEKSTRKKKKGFLFHSTVPLVALNAFSSLHSLAGLTRIVGVRFVTARSLFVRLHAHLIHVYESAHAHRHYSVQIMVVLLRLVFIYIYIYDQTPTHSLRAHGTAS